MVRSTTSCTVNAARFISLLLRLTQYAQSKMQTFVSKIFKKGNTTAIFCVGMANTMRLLLPNPFIVVFSIATTAGAANIIFRCISEDG